MAAAAHKQRIGGHYSINIGTKVRHLKPQRTLALQPTGQHLCSRDGTFSPPQEKNLDSLFYQQSAVLAV